MSSTQPRGAGSVNVSRGRRLLPAAVSGCDSVGLSQPPARLSFCLFAELSVAAGGLSTTPMSPSTVSAQNLLMSSSGVGGEASVTLTLADTQGLLSGALDTVTLNIASQVGAVTQSVRGRSGN